MTEITAQHDPLSAAIAAAEMVVAPAHVCPSHGYTVVVPSCAVTVGGGGRAGAKVSTCEYPKAAAR